jgi:hypothetical protein
MLVNALLLDPRRTASTPLFSIPEFSMGLSFINYRGIE